MRIAPWLPLGLLCLVFLVSAVPAQASDDDELVSMIVNLLGDSDKDMRALALEQVRTEAKGASATQAFAAQLPKLPPDGQAALLQALADRGDTAARPAILNVLDTSRDESVKSAAIKALGVLGEPSDTARLVKTLAEGVEAEQAAARASLGRLTGPSVSSLIAAEMKRASPAMQVTLIGILTTRRAMDAIPDILAATLKEDPSVRTAAMAALGQLAGPGHIAEMLRGVLKAAAGPERDAAEKAVMFVCARIENPEKRAEPLLAALAKFQGTERAVLLPVLGRVGGSEARKLIETAIGQADTQTHEAGLRALCNWPDASVAERLTQLAQADPHDEHRTMALRALVRVAPLPDGRPDRDKLDLLKKAITLCQRDADRNLALQRASAIRIVETLRFLLPYLDEPAYAAQACRSIVELAHHRNLREPNKAEFDRALDKVIATSKDATLVDRAQRYKKGQTWTPPSSN